LTSDYKGVYLDGDRIRVNLSELEKKSRSLQEYTETKIEL
jgi:hypothetical protein